MSENNYQNEHGQKKVYDPEILNPEPGWQTEETSTATGTNRTKYRSGTWLYSVNTNDGCLTAFITLTLFIVCCSSFGLLGGLGFIFFHFLIAMIGTAHAVRRLMEGRYFNIWQWRICNWTISFLLIFWLSGL